MAHNQLCSRQTIPFLRSKMHKINEHITMRGYETANIVKFHWRSEHIKPVKRDFQHVCILMPKQDVKSDLHLTFGYTFLHVTMIGTSQINILLSVFIYYLLFYLLNIILTPFLFHFVSQFLKSRVWLDKGGSCQTRARLDEATLLYWVMLTYRHNSPFLYVLNTGSKNHAYSKTRPEKPVWKE